MIFVTVGRQMPFDRLIAAVDHWALDRPGEDVFAQVGATENPPAHVRWEHFIPPSDFRAVAAEADLIVSHAGMGTILTAIEVQTPILVLPRRMHLNETRTDHQVDTMRRLAERGIVIPADDVDQLIAKLRDPEGLAAVRPPAARASSELRDTIRDFVEGRLRR